MPVALTRIHSLHSKRIEEYFGAAQDVYSELSISFVSCFYWFGLKV